MRQSRKEQKEQTRARLLEAARESFEAQGFEQTTMRAVAKAAGVAVGTVFVHFEDKRDLLCSALFDDLERVLRRALTEGVEGTVQARLHRLTATMFEYYERRPQLSRMLLRESLLASGAWGERFGGQVAQTHEVVAGWLGQGRERGELDASLDPALGAMAYLSFYYFALLGWIQGQPLDPVGLVDRLLGQHLSSEEE